MQRLHLHNTGEQKPSPLGGGTTSTLKKSQEGILNRSFMMVFSDEQSAYDIFKLIRTSYREGDYIDILKAYVPAAWHFAVCLRADRRGVDNRAGVQFLYKVIEMQTKGDSIATRSPEEWIAKANDSSPTAFAALFGGKRVRMVQGLCRDMKLLDAVFEIGYAPYRREAPLGRPFSDVASIMPDPSQGASAESKDGNADDSAALGDEVEHTDRAAHPSFNDGSQAFHKFVHVALQKMTDSNQLSQVCFAAAEMVAHDSEDGRLVTRKAPRMDVLLGWLTDPLGSVVTLSKLLSTNRILMETYAKPSLANRIVQMVADLGPQARFLLFFESICTIDGIPVLANQELILRLLFMDDKRRRRVLVDFEPKPDGIKDMHQEYLAR